MVLREELRLEVVLFLEWVGRVLIMEFSIEVGLRGLVVIVKVMV